MAELRQPEFHSAPMTALELVDRWIEEGKVRAPVSAKVPVSSTGVRLSDGTTTDLLKAERGE